ncbi:MAG: hypothetical protein DRP51_00395 [Candidatus Zixiibacteriota bacterium]|nr:MAG: hypothetical protein DRP51_00395 [candidate division Zixibacteria bacterium]
MKGLIKLMIKMMLCLILITNISFAEYIEQVEEITAGNFFGYGARQMAMGGAGIMAIDGAALFYNPANLARIPRIEFNFGLSNQRYKDISTVRPIRREVDYSGAVTQSGILSPRFEGFQPVLSSAENSKINTRVNSAIITIPYPTYRGSMVFGIGMTRGINFDRVFRLSHSDRSASGDIIALGDEFQSGALTQWGAGIGIDLSPRIAFGGALYLYTGKHNYNWEYALDSLDVLSYEAEDLIVDKYLGFNMKMALSMRLNHYLTLGLAVETPLIFSVEEESSSYRLLDGVVIEDDYSYTEYDIKKPFVFSGGLSAQFNNATLMADFDYTDWSQLEYGDNIEMEKENINIRSYYRDVIRFRLGGEYVFPQAGLSVRAGYFSDPLPIKSSFVNQNRSGFTFGLGLLVDQVMTIDVAFVHGSYERNSDFIYSSVKDDQDNMISSHNLIVDEEVSYNRLYLTTAYRF